MMRSFLCPFVHFGLAMMIVLVGAPNSLAAEEGAEDQLRSANGGVGVARSVIQEPVVSLNAVNNVERVQSQLAARQQEDRRWTLDATKGQPASSRPALALSSAQEGQPGTPRELLPDLGQIGAQVSLLVGVSMNPFKVNQGALAGGYIDLPLAKVRGGKVSYEIAVTNQVAKTDVRITSPLSAVGDLLQADGLGGTQTSTVLRSLKNLPAKEDLDLLTVLPFGLKYTITALDHLRLRPYIVGSFGVYVTITEQNPNLAAPLAGTFIGGIAPEAIELTARGVPEGQGDIRFGGNAGAGVEYRFIGRASLGFEYRFHKIEGTNGSFSTVAGKVGFHF